MCARLSLTEEKLFLLPDWRPSIMGVCENIDALEYRNIMFCNTVSILKNTVLINGFSVL